MKILKVMTIITVTDYYLSLLSKLLNAMRATFTQRLIKSDQSQATYEAVLKLSKCFKIKIQAIRLYMEQKHKIQQDNKVCTSDPDFFCRLIPPS